MAGSGSIATNKEVQIYIKSLITCYLGLSLLSFFFFFYLLVMYMVLVYPITYVVLLLGCKIRTKLLLLAQQKTRQEKSLRDLTPFITSTTLQAIEFPSLKNSAIYTLVDFSVVGSCFNKGPSSLIPLFCLFFYIMYLVLTVL